MWYGSPLGLPATDWTRGPVAGCPKVCNHGSNLRLTLGVATGPTRGRPCIVVQQSVQKQIFCILNICENIQKRFLNQKNP